MAQNEGKRFEQNIKASCEKQGILFERFVDNGKFGFGESAITRFSSENPCDGFLFFEGVIVYVELKTATTGAISHNQPPMVQEKGKTKPSIKANQVKSLIERAGYDGVEAGLLVEFYDRETKTQTIKGGTFYIDIFDFIGWTVISGKKSMNVTDARSIGTPVDSVKLKVNSRYDIRGMLERIK